MRIHSPLVMRCTVPAGHYFVMGDNRYDSRYCGFVRQDQIIGKVVRVFQ